MPSQQAPPTKVKDPLWNLIADVGSKKCTLQVASAVLRDYVHNLTPEELEVWKTGAGDLGRQIMRIAEAFNQEVTVIAAGQ
jgi:hypothetical protein